MVQWPLSAQSRGFITKLLRPLAPLLIAAFAAAVMGDTIILDDGAVVEGTIIKEGSKYVKIETKFGIKSYSRKRISRIVRETDENSALHAIRTIEDFNELSELAQSLKNAQALYKLQRFDEIPAIIEPYIGKGTVYDDMNIRWLLIDNCERQGEWGKAESLLKKTLEDGREADKIRAQVHLDIFEENPGYTLRKIGGKRTTEFLSREMRDRGKRPNALQDPELMQAAVTEVLNQILRDEEISVAALKKDHFNVERTIEAIMEEIEGEEETGKDNRDNSRGGSRSPRSRARSVIQALPYLEAMEKVEKSILKAQAINPQFTQGFSLDLVRSECDHLSDVLVRFLGEVGQRYPSEQNVATDDNTGLLTAAGREQWRQSCDEFLKLSRPTEELIEYMLRRAEAYPKTLEPLIKQWEQVLERVKQMQQNTVRNYDRTRA